VPRCRVMMSSRGRGLRDQLHFLHTLRKCRRHAPSNPLLCVSKTTRPLPPLRAREPHFPKGEGTQSHARCRLRCSRPRVGLAVRLVNGRV
jgi:hypothetical protein